MLCDSFIFFFFFFNDTATTEIYTLSLHDALPISHDFRDVAEGRVVTIEVPIRSEAAGADRKSTRLNSSHLVISYAVFCLKKKTHKEPQLALPIDRNCATPQLPLALCRRYSHQLLL